MTSLALDSLEHPDTYRHMYTFGRVLCAIKSRAEFTEEHISSQAHQVGCAFTDEESLRRCEAWHAFQQSAKKGV
ncbi:MAG: hypothetical protein LBF61_11000 [Azoarcus sp.]|nr:hypothetical protein [Azoarcus sp.]